VSALIAKLDSHLPTKTSNLQRFE